ncbi:flagellar hook-basal body complex protein [Roseovarius sp. SYSU LYC5161]|uniref:flagellar hook-basal body complex protein n=1 Tax=Roseovarius halophilus (ex Wu et al. 2025) TaxID=3376060 RepID=UPI002871A6EF|nr:flagellar hook-basal body complex protein [Roseovarius sp.]
MENAGYATLSRQSGLIRELQVVANNIANASTAGFRQEGLVFAEHVKKTREGPPLSMPHASISNTSLSQGSLRETGARLDFAIEGDGFFQVQTAEGPRLTRAGNFTLSGAGDVMTSDGFPVLDAGGAPIFVPPDARDVSVASDGTITADGRPLAQIGIVMPADRLDLQREDGVRFRTEGPLEPVAEPRILQGFVESANVDPVTQVARMVEIQRAYELGQSFLDAENERIRSAIETLTR